MKKQTPPKKNISGTFSEIKEIQLDEVTVSVLSKESYSKLNQAQKQVYDNMNKIKGTKGNKSIKPVNAEFSYNKLTSQKNNETRSIDPITAVKMIGETGVKKIYNKPSKIVSRRKNADKTFRAHANTFTSTIHVESPKSKSERALGNYIKDVFSEAAHIADPKKFSPKSMYEGAAGAFNENKQNKSYEKKGSMEYRTHSVIEPALVKKYTKNRKGKY